MITAWLHTVASRVRGMFFRRSTEEDFDQEVQAHLAILTEENIRLGMTPDEAARQARVRFGGITQIKESQREDRGLPQLDTFWQDIRYAARVLRRSPGFTLIATLTLALGIGVNTTIFTAFDAVALRPLPVKDPDSVVRLERWFESGSHGNGQYLFSYPEYTYYRSKDRAFSSLIAASMHFPVFGDFSEPNAKEGAPRASERLHCQLVSGNYFSDLGVNAMLGRTFLSEENSAPGAHPVVVLSYPFWRLRFNADPAILGRVVQLNGAAFTVIGVMPEPFIGTGNPPQVPDIWAPLMMQAQLVPAQDWLNLPNSCWFQIFARLKPGTSLKEAQAEAGVLASQFGRSYPPRDKTIALTLEQATFFGETNDIRFKAFVVLLMVVVGMVLLIACANLANMLLARACSRKREISVRLALGAGRGRLIRQLLTESVLLALLGGAVGLLFSIWASRLLWVGIQRAIQDFLSTGVTLVVSMTPDASVFGYTLLVSILTGIVFGLSPALQFSKPDVASALKDEAGAFGQSRSRLRSFLLATQVAASMVLLISAGLLLRGVAKSESADPGFETRRVFWVGLNYGTDAAKAKAIYQRVLERLPTVPQIRSFALSDRIPMTGTWTTPVAAGVVQKVSGNWPETTLASYVSPTYFETLGIALVRGRTFSRKEGAARAPVAIVSESSARKFWPNEEPLGKRVQLQMDRRGRQWGEFEVVGVAKDVRSANLSRVDPGLVYLAAGENQFNNILIRIDGDPKSAIAALRASMESLDRNLLPGMNAMSLEDGPVRKQRLLAQTYALFAALLAGLALLLAGVGIYGVMSYVVSQRTRDIGIHMALGATARNVLRTVVLDGLRPVLVGACLGLIGAAGVASLLKAILVFPSSPDMLFGVSVFDPATFLGLSGFLALVAAIASAIPARHAARVDPMVALRYE